MRLTPLLINIFHSKKDISKDLKLLYRKFIGSDSTWSVVRPQTHELESSQKMALATTVCREFAAEHVIQSTHTQKQICRTFHGLSIGIQRIKFPSKITPEMKRETTPIAAKLQ